MFSLKLTENQASCCGSNASRSSAPGRRRRRDVEMVDGIDAVLDESAFTPAHDLVADAQRGRPVADVEVHPAEGIEYVDAAADAIERFVRKRCACARAVLELEVVEALAADEDPEASVLELQLGRQLQGVADEAPAEVEIAVVAVDRERGPAIGGADDGGVATVDAPREAVGQRRIPAPAERAALALEADAERGRAAAAHRCGCEQTCRTHCRADATLDHFSPDERSGGSRLDSPADSWKHAAAAGLPTLVAVLPNEVPENNNIMPLRPAPVAAFAAVQQLRRASPGARCDGSARSGRASRRPRPNGSIRRTPAGPARSRSAHPAPSAPG